MMQPCPRAESHFLCLTSGANVPSLVIDFMVLRTDIDQLAQQIAREFKPERIILFGSNAYGAPTEDSDVDLLVITPLRSRGCQKAAEIRRKIRPPFPLDLLVRSPEEVQARVAMNDCFVKEILAKGRVLSASDHRRVD